MFVLIVMFVVFFSVAIASWWLDDFGEVENERTPKPTANYPSGFAIAAWEQA